VDELILLLGLLVFSYAGSVLVAPGQSSAFALPSGSHFVVLGFLLGPHALGVVPSDAAASFRPLAIVATAWLALILGVEYGHSGDRRLSVRAFVRGFFAGLISAAAIGVPVYLAARYLAHLNATDARLLGIGIGLAGCETARQSVRFVVDRGAEHGRLLRLLEELADTDELVPLLGMGALFAIESAPLSGLELPYGGWLGLTALFGLLLGLTSALLVSSFAAAQDAWGVLLGAALLGAGVTWRLSLSPLSVSFLMGVCLGMGSRHGAELRSLLARTEPGVLLPTLLLAGGLLRLPSAAGPLWVMGIALASRVAIRCALGYLLARLAKSDPARRAPFGLSLCCSGSVSVILSLSFALRFPGPVGDLVLSAAAVSGIAGDLLGTLGLRRAFVMRESLAPPYAVSSP
jgi:hypothetical protein